MPEAGAPALPVPPLRPYSAQPKRLALQLASDVFVLVWIYVWYRVGQLVHDTLVQVAGVGYRIQGSAGQVSGSLTQAGRSAGNLPLVGENLGRPLTDAGAQIGDIASAGRSAGDTLTNLATPLGWAVALGPILLVLAIWLPRRWRFARRAGEAAEMATGPAGEELLALRALANRPLQELRRVAPDPVRAWRDGDAGAIRALAHLELTAEGVRRRRRGPVRATATATATAVAGPGEGRQDRRPDARRDGLPGAHREGLPQGPAGAHREGPAEEPPEARGEEPREGRRDARRD